MTTQKEELREMFRELKEYEKQKIDLGINGIPASPMQIVQAHIMCEDLGYMRDYVLNEKGDIKALWFNHVEL
ncbi:hypothetical protein [uncultured Merdimonas sp.]|uniref:hypothetical protein n=1 Tax=uncultured Merdimonas sp. TaxID=2023269 RepID=UPI003207C72F